jgi:hypothetical protein
MPYLNDPTYPQLLEESNFIWKLFQVVVVKIQNLETSSQIDKASSTVQSYKLVFLRNQRITTLEIRFILHTS